MRCRAHCWCVCKYVTCIQSTPPPPPTSKKLIKNTHTHKNKWAKVKQNSRCFWLSIYSSFVKAIKQRNIKNALTPRWIFRINYDFLTRLKRFKIEHKWGCCPKKLYNSDPKRTARLQIDSFNFEFKPVFMQRRYLLHLNRDIYKWTKICIL